LAQDATARNENHRLRRISLFLYRPAVPPAPSWSKLFFIDIIPIDEQLSIADKRQNTGSGPAGRMGETSGVETSLHPAVAGR
jgi:hypothetical protein